MTADSSIKGPLKALTRIALFLILLPSFLTWWFLGGSQSIIFVYHLLLQHIGLFPLEFNCTNGMTSAFAGWFVVLFWVFAIAPIFLWPRFFAILLLIGHGYEITYLLATVGSYYTDCQNGAPVQFQRLLGPFQRELILVHQYGWLLAFSAAWFSHKTMNNGVPGLPVNESAEIE